MERKGSIGAVGPFKWTSKEINSLTWAPQFTTEKSSSLKIGSILQSISDRIVTEIQNVLERRFGIHPDKCKWHLLLLPNSDTLHWNNVFLAEIARFTSKILSCWKEKAKDVTKRNSNLAQVCLNFQKKFTNYTSKYSWWGQAQFQFLERDLQIRVHIVGSVMTNIKVRKYINYIKIT